MAGHYRIQFGDFTQLGGIECRLNVLLSQYYFHTTTSQGLSFKISEHAFSPLPDGGKFFDQIQYLNSRQQRQLDNMLLVNVQVLMWLHQLGANLERTASTWSAMLLALRDVRI